MTETTKPTLDELLTLEPFVGKAGDISAHLLTTEALGLTAAQTDAMDDDELEDRALEWLRDGSAESELSALDWDIDDSRFSHATKVVDVEVDEIEFVGVDGGEGGFIDLDVDIHETPEGYRDRLRAEAQALGRMDVVESLSAQG